MTQRSRRQTAMFATALVLLAATTGWIAWAESHPRQERELRDLIQTQLQVWFPAQMEPSQDGWHGLEPLLPPRDSDLPNLVLVHGLDEPGVIWDDLIRVLAQTDHGVWRLRYPNDQAVARSAEFLAERWRQLPTDRPVVLIGHSMGGLVIRDFVSGWRHPVDRPPRVAGAKVRGVVLLGTPNHGSEWARLRIWLELREQLQDAAALRFSLWAALRDGTGAAKIDLRPGSPFLTELNARAWPTDIPIVLIGGELLKATPAMASSLAAIQHELPSAELAEALDNWWSQLGDQLGDGVVTEQSLRLPNAAPPILVPASHRGMIRRMRQSDRQPPAIAPLLDVLEQLSSSRSSSPRPGAPPATD